MTLIRLIRALPEPALQNGPAVLSVDDFALRKGRIYGTILIDISTGRPIDVLPDRTADTLATWLQEHPGVEIVCRDRAGAYADGASRGAPEATQVADRWHVWRNLDQAVERTIATHRRHLQAISPASVPQSGPAPALLAPPPPAAQPPRTPETRQDRVAVRTRERHAAIHELLAQGQPLRQIALRLHPGRNTVRRFARATTPEELLVHAGTGQQAKSLEVFDDYLRQRWADGCTNAEQLYRELQTRGYPGASTVVRQYVRSWRTALPAAPPSQRPPTVRQAVGWFLRNPANLDPDEQSGLDTLCATSPQLAALRGHIRHFAEMMTHRRGRQLDAWMTAVLADDLPELHSFVKGLRRGREAVAAGLTLPYSSGPVEGHVNRIKTIKRQMYGRAKHDLLRLRVLLAD